MLSDLEQAMDEASGLAKDGVERDLQEALAARPDWLEEELRLVRREWSTEVGPVDLMCRDCDDGWVAVEIKRLGTIEAVEQLTRYLGFIRVDPAKERVSRDPRRAALQAAGGHARRVARDPLRGGRSRAPAGRARAGADALRLGNDCGLQVVARRIGQQRRDAFEADAMGDQQLPRMRAAREKRERGAHVARRVVEGAA